MEANELLKAPVQAFVSGTEAVRSALAQHVPSPDDFKGAETWPMPVNRFLAGDYLKRADIVLTRKAGNPFSWAIRKATGSRYSHAALVFHVRSQADGYNNNFVIEAGTHGVDITNLRDYAASHYYVTGIKRFERDWFTDDLRRYVRGHLLDHIKDEYDWWRAITLSRALIRAYIFRDWRPFQQSERARMVRIRRGSIANEFICSGLVQYGYFNALYKLVRASRHGAKLGEEGRAVFEDGSSAPVRRSMNADALKEVLFSKELETLLDLTPEGRFKSFGAMRRFWNAMHATTPRDFEVSDKLQWLYVIREGLVHKVATNEEADAIARKPVIIPYDPSSA